MFALVFALVVSSAGQGWLAPLIGLAVAIGGSTLAILVAPRPSASATRRAPA